MPRFFGTPDGIRVGQQFVDRRELHDLHVHRPLQAGISGIKAEGSDSIVVSGGYRDDEDHGDWIIYTGHGGNDANTGRQIDHQTIDAPGNAGLITIRAEGLPVRVIRGRHVGSGYAPSSGYVYAGLFEVTDYWILKGLDDFDIVRFKLERLPEQAELVMRALPDPDPAYATTTVSRRIRDTALSREVKKLYAHHCQIRDEAITGADGRTYSEGAHLKPLGRPHIGRDSLDSLLCLCRNHHAQLDLGGLVLFDDFSVARIADLTPIARLSFKRATSPSTGPKPPPHTLRETRIEQNIRPRTLEFPMATYDVAHRSAIVTGAGSGIGRAVALELAANGASVIVADLVKAPLTTLLDEIRAAGGTAEMIIGDVSDPDYAIACVADANALAPLRIAVNNAGIGGEQSLIGDYSLDSWRKVIEVNLNAVFYGLRAQLPSMAENGGGSIINMASILGSVGFPTSSAYVTAKHGLLGLTQNAALEYGAKKVRTNAVGPGFIHTPLVDSALDAATQDFLAAKHALGRLGTPQEVSALVCFLASDSASFISGSYHLVDGGYVAQ